MASSAVNCVVTSPPYFGQRDYGVDGQIGQEPTVATYVARLVDVFREVRRVLRDDGTLWLNLGDTYAKYVHGSRNARASAVDSLPAKSMMGVPWRVAFALQADGWLFRQDIVWAKNALPESVMDRCTRSHEFIFLFSKRASYHFDATAIREPRATARRRAGNRKIGGTGGPACRSERAGAMWGDADWRNRRDVWSIPTGSFNGDHAAAYPPALVEPCILAGCPVGGTVLDPFAGTGTTAGVALRHGRRAVLCELNPRYVAMMSGRIARIAGHSVPLIRHHSALMPSTAPPIRQHQRRRLRHIDEQTRTIAEADAVRQRAMDLFRGGARVAVVANDLAVPASTASRWLKRLRHEGRTANLDRRQDRTPLVVTADEERRLRRLVAISDPAACGIQARRWSGATVATLISRKLGRRISRRTGVRLLARWRG